MSSFGLQCRWSEVGRVRSILPEARESIENERKPVAPIWRYSDGKYSAAPLIFDAYAIMNIPQRINNFS